MELSLTNRGSEIELSDIDDSNEVNIYIGIDYRNAYWCNKDNAKQIIEHLKIQFGLQ